QDASDPRECPGVQVESKLARRAGRTEVDEGLASCAPTRKVPVGEHRSTHATDREDVGLETPFLVRMIIAVPDNQLGAVERASLPNAEALARVLRVAQQGVTGGVFVREGGVVAVPDLVRVAVAGELHDGGAWGHVSVLDAQALAGICVDKPCSRRIGPGRCGD